MQTFLWPALGGVLIGASAVLLMLLIGRIAGISGIVWGAITAATSERVWRWLFLIGMICGALLFHAVSGVSTPEVHSNLPLAAIAGLLVGCGVKIGNGCTSGHGVCGIGRLSVRSLVATVSFMLVAIVTVFVTRHVFNLV